MHGCSGSLLVVPSSYGMHSKTCTGIGFLIADEEIILNYPGGLDVITRVFIRRKQEDQSEKEL